MLNFRKTAAFIAAAAFTLSNTCVYASDIDITQTKTADGFRYVVTDDEIVITGYANTREPETVIPEEIDGKPVTRINALWGKITEITVPDSVKTIDENAFKGNTWLKNAVIPESVTSMGENVFSGCTALESCELMADINEIPKGTFFGCTALSDLTYSDDINSLGGGAFSGCEKITHIDIPDEMTVLPGSLFNGCISLESIELPEGLVSIENSALKNCSSLTQVTIPQGVEYIGEYAFSGCSSVKEFIIPDGVEIINDGLFSGCTALENVKLPETAQTKTENTTKVFGAELFKGCSSLTEIILPDGMRDIGEKCFDGCTSLEAVYIPDTVVYIDNYAFRNCSSLKEIELPGYSVIYGKETFAGCSSLKEFFVPETVYSFAGGGSAAKTFAGCSSLETIYLPSDADVYIDSFDGCDSLQEIYIGSLNGSFAEKHLGYIHNEGTGEYTKNENLSIYCREDSSALKYAEKYGFNYETVEGVEAHLMYFGTYDDPEEADELYITELNIDKKTFVNGEGEFRTSQDYITLTNEGKQFTGLKNSLELGIYLGFDAETYSDIEAFPSYLNYDGTNLFEVYDEIFYSTEVLDDGYWYLIVECRSSEENDVTAGQIKGRKMNVGFVVEDIVLAGEETDTVKGDVNGDGIVTTADYILLKNYLLSVSGVKISSGADMNSDGKTDVSDFILLKAMMMH